MRRYFDRGQAEDLSGPFSEWPLLLCPACRGASLEPSVNTLYDRESTAALEGADWDPLSLGGIFHGDLACPRSPCGNKYVVAGTWGVDYDGESSEGHYAEFFSVSYILPALPLMEYPDAVPDKIRDPISAASLVLLSDASAAANRIRSAIEALLDCQRVRKHHAGNRSARLTTHARIKEFEARNPDAAAQLMAVKWIGNAGSHEREALPLSLVLDGMEHFARALELIYDPHEEKLRRRAALINQQGRKLRMSRRASA
jgi:Domain of unknown function (DUF4145)